MNSYGQQLAPGATPSPPRQAPPPPPPPSGGGPRPNIELLLDDLAVLTQVGRMYLDALDADPEHELLTLVEALRVTEVREAVERAEARNEATS